MGFDAQGLIKWHRLEVFDGHFRGHGDNVAKFVELAHGVVEDGCDDSAVAVSGRAGVTFAEAKIADEAVPFMDELQVHALGIVVAAGETEVFLLWVGFCGVAAGRSLQDVLGHQRCILPDGPFLRIAAVSIIIEEVNLGLKVWRIYFYGGEDR